MSIIEIEAAIARLPPGEVSELMTWLEKYHVQLMADDLGSGRFDSLIAEAYASGEPTPLTKADIDSARRIVKERIAARTEVK